MSKVTGSGSDLEPDIRQRKADHIRINLEENVDFPHLTSGLERYRFVHRALPELNLADIDTTLALFGRRLAAPLLISSMTGGTDRARELNRRLAAAAQVHGIAMGSAGEPRDRPHLSST